MSDTLRYNVEKTDDGYRFCRGDHHRSQDCEWEYCVPKAHIQALQSDLRTLAEAVVSAHKWNFSVTWNQSNAPAITLAQGILKGGE